MIVVGIKWCIEFHRSNWVFNLAAGYHKNSLEIKHLLVFTKKITFAAWLIIKGAKIFILIKKKPLWVSFRKVDCITCLLVLAESGQRVVKVEKICLSNW